MFFASILLTAVFISAVRGKDDVFLVNTGSGAVAGFKQTTTSGIDYIAFQGIPYAKPPVGERRFKAPEPIDPWDGVWDAKFPTICAQSDPFLANKTSGSEDCLHLNVYVPINKLNSNANLDVIFHIHGGGFLWGHGTEACDPNFLMEHDVIFVTINYRLGILGFISTEDDVISGNMGLKDQNVAIKWVHDNIRSFGGNPESVTLTGFSAGSGSVHLHYFSEMSKGLFRRGFGHSGTAFDPWTITEEPLKNTKKIANLVGCPEYPNNAMANCLRQRPWKHLVDKVFAFYTFFYFPVVPFGAVIEKGPNAFLTDYPYKLAQQGRIYDVPWVLSHTSHEGVVVGPGLNALDALNEHWLELAPSCLAYDTTLPPSQWKQTAQKIKDYYIGPNEDISAKNTVKVIKLFSDRLFTVDGQFAARVQAKLNRSPVYYYTFSYVGEHNDQKLVGHGGDIVYIYGKNFLIQRDLTATELKMKDLMVNMLLSYARTGVPQFPCIDWQPITTNNLTGVDVRGFEPRDIKPINTNDFSVRAFWKSLGFAENDNL